MSRIPEDLIETIRQAVDITDLIGRYVPLKRSGRSFKGCCPIHGEKTPSFHVWPETSTWKCFGCGKGGNIFGFLMEKEMLTFPEAVRQVAQSAGIEIEAETPEARRRSGHLQRLRELTEWACRFFEAALRGPRGESGRDYFKRRGITSETAETFRLGFALPGWDNLLRAALDSGWAEDELVEAGLVVRREPEGGRKKLYDMFRERVVFPISDPQGRVIAFGARTLGSDEPKYVNSPETPLYTKGQHLYALHLAKNGMMKTGEGAVMEGYTDVILAHQAGWPVAVAGLGTALTDRQATSLARYVKRLWLVYDGDAAGRRAAEKAIPAFLREDIETRVALLAGGQDPADLVLEGGVAALRAAIDDGREAFEHLLETAAADHDSASVPGRAAATETVLNALAGVTDEIRRALYVKRLADAYGVPEDVISTRLREMARKLKEREARSQRSRSGPGPRGRPPASGSGDSPARPAAVGAIQGDEPPLDAYLGAMEDTGDDDYVPEPTRAGAQAPPRETDARPTPVPVVERMFLEALVGCPDLAAEVPDEGDELLTHSLAAELLSQLLAAFDALEGAALEPGSLVSGLQTAELQGFAADLLVTAGDKPELPRQFRDCVVRLRMERERRLLREREMSAQTEDEAFQTLLEAVDFHRRRSGLAGGEGV